MASQVLRKSSHVSVWPKKRAGGVFAFRKIVVENVG